MLYQLEVDYLVVGGGAMGMAFTDEVLLRNSNKKLRVGMVDMRGKCGGHWNDAYDFVTLQMPSDYYGINSLKLEKKKGELATKSQILAYYEQCKKKFENTGRFTFFPQCKYLGQGCFISLLDEKICYKATIVCREVDATYYSATIPALTPPSFQVDDKVPFIPVNGLNSITTSYEKFIIIGGGKTGIDALLHLITLGIPPERLVWVVPNNVWLTKRELFMPDELYQNTRVFIKSILAAESPQDAIKIMEKKNWFQRLDETCCPGKIQCATVSSEEYNQLKKVKNVISKGKIKTIEEDRLIFENDETLETQSSWLLINCTADGSIKRPEVPIFQEGKLVLQPVLFRQQIASAAMIAALEAQKGRKTDAALNAILKPIKHPISTPEEVLNGFLRFLQNEERFSSQGPGHLWLWRSRLNFSHHMGLWQLSKLKWLKQTQRARIQKEIEAFL